MMSEDGSLELSVVVPTFNERENLPRLAGELFAAFRDAGIRGELVIVDDDSPDGTAQTAAGLACAYPIRTLVRKGRRGLSSAVLEGVSAAGAPVVCVMDADLSHPPGTVPRLFRAVREGADIAVGSRLIPGGGVEGWPLSRRLLSRGATLLARPLTAVRDPMSGFFCFRKAILRGARLEPGGYKILLEILARCDPARAVEVPYLFRNRHLGSSKLSGKVMGQYLGHLLRLYASRIAG